MTLIEGVFLRRYKRFFADIKLPSGEEVVAHVPNTGSMLSCLQEGWKALLSFHDDPKRKLKFTLEFIVSPQGLIGVNTGKTNALVAEALREHKIPECQGYTEITQEKSILDSRFDFFLAGHPQKPDCFIEVKNVTLAEGDYALFPDAVTTRGQKHLRELIELKHQGYRAIMMFVVQREGIRFFSSARKIDLHYSELLEQAHREGVEVLVYQTRFQLPKVSIDRALTWKEL